MRESSTFLTQCKLAVALLTRGVSIQKDGRQSSWVLNLSQQGRTVAHWFLPMPLRRAPFPSLSKSLTQWLRDSAARLEGPRREAGVAGGRAGAQNIFCRVSFLGIPWGNWFQGQWTGSWDYICVILQDKSCWLVSPPCFWFTCYGPSSLSICPSEMRGDGHMLPEMELGVFMKGCSVKLL